MKENFFPLSVINWREKLMQRPILFHLLVVVGLGREHRGTLNRSSSSSFSVGGTMMKKSLLASIGWRACRPAGSSRRTSGSGATCYHLAPAHPHAPVPLWHSSRLHDNDGDGEAEGRRLPSDKWKLWQRKYSGSVMRCRSTNCFEISWTNRLNKTEK